MDIRLSILTLMNLSVLSSILLLIYVITVGLYRLYWSPLAAYPGPKLAALSNWYEFYYDVILQGKFTSKIQDLHRQYGTVSSSLPPSVTVSLTGAGPIIRIT